MNRIPWPMICVFALAAVVPSLPNAGQACAPAPARFVTVDIATESATIIWDSQSQTQHFIRRAEFVAKSTAEDKKPVADFGFLVPTPTQPTLEEASDDIFKQLAIITAPKTDTRQAPANGGFCPLGCGMASKTQVAGNAVEVLETKKVAGYDAAVLKASDADALTTWLTKNGYEMRPALTRWVKPYIDQKWIITAFKIAKAPDASADTPIGSTAVRMSFRTEKPIFPYREPDDMHASQVKRLLRIYFLSDARMAGTLGEKGQWPGRTVWAGPIPADKIAALKDILKTADTINGKPWHLTEFEDSSSPRPGTEDLIFSAAADQSPVERPRNIVYAANIPGTVLPYLALTLGLCGFVVSRRRWSRTKEQ